MILELSGDFPVNLLCEKMGIQRSSFYNWKHTLAHPAKRTKALLNNLSLFEEYHLRYPSHGYRWLNAKIRLDTGIVMSDPYAHKCCKILGVKSEAKHYKYKKPGNPFKIYPNLLMSEMQIDRPLQCVVSDMTAFYVKGIYYELTLYMDLWKNDPFNFFHPDFNCCYRNRTGSARRFAEFTASREFHSALKFYFMRYQYTTMLCTSQQKLDTNFKYYLSINLISVQYGASFATFLSG